MGNILISELKKLEGSNRFVQHVRGKGLWAGVVMDPNHKGLKGKSIYEFCGILRDNGLLAKQTHENIIRIAPPLVINESQVFELVNIFKKCTEYIEN
jgi:ornithine--oxo-acid transaminase